MSSPSHDVPIHRADALQPLAEEDRVAVLHRYGILDTPPEPEFNEIARLAAQICGTPMALVNLVDRDRQWFKASIGVGVPQLPRSSGFCHLPLSKGGAVVIEDTHADPEHARNPVVAGPPHLRFYAGVPIETAEGARLGTVCVMDVKPRNIAPEAVQALHGLARQVLGQLELRRALEERRRADARLRAQTATAELLAADRPWEETAPRLAQVIGESLGWEHAALWRVGSDGALRANATWRHPAVPIPAFEEATRAAALRSGEGLVGIALARRAHAWSTRFPEEAHASRAAAASEGGVRTLVCAPIRNGETIYGILEVATTRVEHEDPAFTQVLRGLGAQVGLFLERRKAQEELRASHDRRGAILDSSLDCVITIDHLGRILEWNRAAEATFGYGREEAIGRDMGDLIVPPEMREGHRRGMAHFLLTGEGPVLGKRLELPAMRRDGTVFPSELAILRLPDTEPPVFTGFLRDISERKRAEAELEGVKGRLQRILDAAGEGIYGVDENGVTTFMNEAALKMTGLTREQAVGRKLHDVIHHTRADGRPYPAHECHIYKAAHGGDVVSCNDEVFWRVDGTSFPVDYVTSPIEEGGRVVGAVTVFRDVTEHRRAERALRESEARYRLLAEHSKDLITRSDANGRFTYLSPASREVLGYEPAELVGRLARELVHPDDAEAVAARREKLQHERTAQTLTMRYRRKDGRYVWLEIVATPLVDAATGEVSEIVASWRDITDRKMAEDALKQSEERFRSLSESSPIGIFMADMEGKATYTNGSAQAICGFSEDEALGVGWMSFVHPDDAQRVAAAWAEYAGSGRPYEDEFRWLHHDGTVRWSRVRAAPVLNDDGVHVGHVGTVEDITERREADERLRESTGRLEVALRAADLGAWDLDLTNDTAKRSLRHDQIFGYAKGADDWSAERFFGHVVPEDRDEVRRAFDDALTTGRLDFECRIHRVDGKIAWIAAQGAVVHEDGTPVRMLGVIADITDRVQAKEAVERERILLTTILQQMPAGVIVAQAPLGRLLLANDEVNRILGHAPIPTQGIEQYAQYTAYSPVDGRRLAPEELPLVRSLTRGETVVAEEVLYDRADGKRVSLLVNCAPVRAADGTLVAAVAAFWDITDRKRFEQELERRAADLAKLSQELQYQRDLNRTITDNAASGLFMMDTRGHPIFVNPAGLAMTGYASLDEIKDRPLHYAVHFRRPDGTHYPMEECPIDNASAQLRPLKDQREIFCRKDGTLFPVEYNVAPVVKDGKEMGAVLEVRDVTEQERAEQTLRQRAEELMRLTEALQRSNRELDQFAYITSHDLKAPLRGIANLSRWIEEDAIDSLTPESKDHLELLRGRVNRMEALIDAILEYSRVGRVKTKPEEIDVGRMIHDVADLLSPPVGFHIEIGPRMPTLVAERARLQQVFMNLIGNAIKHHHDKANGHVWIDAEDAGDHYRFCVRDDGPGIAPRFHERVFVIFQTLEARDKVEGTGIGLALVKKIVESQGGSVTLESDEGRGATFRFTWPKTPPPQGGA